MSKYNAMTSEEFARILGELVEKANASTLLAIPGVYEAVSEEFNNEVLECWLADQDLNGEHGPTDSEGDTAEVWMARQFEFETCEECGGDVEDHDAILTLGNWIARCKTEGAEG